MNDVRSCFPNNPGNMSLVVFRCLPRTNPGLGGRQRLEKAQNKHIFHWQCHEDCFGSVNGPAIKEKLPVFCCCFLTLKNFF